MRLGDLGLLAASALAALSLSCQAILGQRPTTELPPGHPMELCGPYDEPPVPVATAEPTYPAFAREAQIKGTVVIHVWIDERGRISQVHVYRGITGVNDAAVEAAIHWVFKPAMKAGKPVASCYEIPFDFPPESG